MATVQLYTSASAYISEYYPDENFGEPVRLFVGRFQGVGDIYRSLLKFDLSKMPQKVTVKSALLRLYVGRKDIPDATLTPQTVTVYQLLQSFNEFSTTWNNQPPIGTAAGSRNVLDGDLDNYISIDITSLVTGWLNGTIANTGILLEGIEVSDVLIGFQGDYDNNYTVWPTLIVDYVAGTTTTYASQILNFAIAGTNTTTAIELGPKTEISFNVRVSGVGAATSVIELSNDGVNWITELVTPISIGVGGEAVISSSAVAQYARLRVTALGELTATITPATREL